MYVYLSIYTANVICVSNMQVYQCVCI